MQRFHERHREGSPGVRATLNSWRGPSRHVYHRRRSLEWSCPRESIRFRRTSRRLLEGYSNVRESARQIPGGSNFNEHRAIGSIPGDRGSNRKSAGTPTRATKNPRVASRIDTRYRGRYVKQRRKLARPTGNALLSVFSSIGSFRRDIVYLSLKGITPKAASSSRDCKNIKLPFSGSEVFQDYLLKSTVT